MYLGVDDEMCEKGNVGCEEMGADGQKGNSDGDGVIGRGDPSARSARNF